MPQADFPDCAKASTCSDTSGRTTWNAISLPGPGWTVIAMGPDYEHTVDYDWANRVVRYRTPKKCAPFVSRPDTPRHPHEEQYHAWGGMQPPAPPMPPPGKGFLRSFVDVVMRPLKHRSAQEESPAAD